MKKNLKSMLCLLLVLVLVLQFPGMTAFADDPKGDEALVFELFVPNPDPEAAEKLLPVTADKEAELLKEKPYSVVWKVTEPEEKTASLSRDPGELKLEDLLKGDLVITPPEGFAVSGLYLRGDAVEADKLKALPSTAEAKTAILTVKAGSLGIEDEESEELVFDKEVLSSLSTADPQVYTLTVVFSPIDPEGEIAVTVKDPESKTAQKPGEEYTVPAAPEEQENRKFSGWLVSYENGATLLAQPDDVLTPYADCSLEAQWTEIITVTAKAPVPGEDGKTFAPDGYTYTGTLREGDKIADVTLTVKEADGKYICSPSAAVIKNGDKDVSDQYILQYVDSTAVEAPKDKTNITITAKPPVTNDKGESYVHDGYELSGELNEGDALTTLTIEVKKTEDGKYVAVPSAAVIKNGDTDNTDNYNITYVQSAAVEPAAPEKIKLAITAKPPVTNDEGKTYVHDGYTISGGSLNEGDKITSLTIEIKETEDGKFQAVPSAAVIKNGDTDNTELYEIEYIPSEAVEPAGKDKIALTIRSKDRTVEYDGSKQTADAYEITEGALEEGDTLEVTFEGGTADVTESPVESRIASAVIKDKDGNDVTESKYALTIDNEHAGKVTVTRHALTITAITGTVETDGTKTIKASECKTATGTFNGGYKAEGLLTGHELRGSFVLGSGTETFTTSIDKSAVKIVDTQNGDADVTGNYEIKTVDGKITIKVTPKTDVPVAVTTKDQSWTYDGTAHKLDQTGYSVSGLLNGDVATVTLQIKVGDKQVDEVTDAGTYSIVPVITIRTQDGAAVDAGKYKITTTGATLTVNKFDLTLEAVSASKAYDGKALRNDNVKASALVAGQKFRDKDGVKFTVTDSKGNLVTNGVVNVGTYTKRITEVHIIDSKGNEVTDNYNIKKIDGTLTITKGTTPDNDSTQPKTGDTSTNRPLFIILIVASAILLASILAYVILQNRKKLALEQGEEVYEEPLDAEFTEAEELPQTEQAQTEQEEKPLNLDDDKPFQFPDDWKL